MTNLRIRSKILKSYFTYVRSNFILSYILRTYIIYISVNSTYVRTKPEIKRKEKKEQMEIHKQSKFFYSPDELDDD